MLIIFELLFPPLVFGIIITNNPHLSLAFSASISTEHRKVNELEILRAALLVWSKGQLHCPSLFVVQITPSYVSSKSRLHDQNVSNQGKRVN
jgi:hypothetical protein